MIGQYGFENLVGGDEPSAAEIGIFLSLEISSNEISIARISRKIDEILKPS